MSGRVGGACVFLENDLSEYLSLDGEWSFSLAGSEPVLMAVPGAWEAHVRDKRVDGPALYAREVDVPGAWLDGRRVLFEAGAVSFDVTLRVNGQEAGRHRGMWSPFQLDVSGLVREGRNRIELEVWKPGGRFLLRETLAGFLPDVCTAFGGPWQGLGLRVLGAGIGDVRVTWDGRHQINGWVVGAEAGADVEVALVGADGGRIAAARSEAGAEGEFSIELAATGLERWRPGSPRLHQVVVTVEREGEVVARAARRVGAREVRVRDGALWLDERPLHLRGVLDWGWHPDLICPRPDRERVRRQFEQARALGFNLVKLCLFVPDEATFDAADELGMLLWLELPLWLPRLTPKVKALAAAEYEAILKRVHHHPSIVVVSLGCELNAEAGADFLQQLSALARHWLPSAIHCDNSGSAEAYGGTATALSDVYDYHFYTDPHFFQPLVEHFDRGYRARKPWLYGEFCDVDTGRDFSKLRPPPWWLTDPVALERDDYLYMRDGAERMRRAGVTDGGARLTAIARKQATAIRKYILEQTRAHGAAGGYVISGWADTPITTSGIVDDQGELKFEPEDWRRFNADAVLLMDRERRRRWVGGDRPAHRDAFCFWAGEQAEIHLLLANALGAGRAGRLRWRLAFANGREWAAGEMEAGDLPAGAAREIGVASVRMPAPAETEGEHGAAPSAALLEMTFQATLELMPEAGTCARTENAWQLWVAPRVSLPKPLALGGPLQHDHGLGRLGRGLETVALEAAPLDMPFLTDALTPEVLERVRAGGRGVWWVRRPDSRFTRNLPFWREAIHVFEPHGLWARAPQPGYADLRYFSVATDLALDLERLSSWLGPGARCRPVWRRFDARQMTWAEHIVDAALGAGRLLVSGLRFEGGQGRQPETFDANPMGAWLLASLLAEVGA
jgi:hypothetical protein